MNSTTAKKSIATTSLVLCAALAMFVASCASSDNSGPTGTGTGTGTGTSVSCSGADTTCFATGQAKGLMTGYGWVALGAQDSITSPTCGGTTITSANSCTTSTTWSTESALCITGAIPVVTKNASGSDDYTNNWGIQIGVNANQTELTPIGDKGYKTITLNFTGAPSPVGAAVRAELHRSTDGTNTVTYCANAVSGQAIQLTKFNTECWSGGKGVDLADGDIQNIDKVGLQICSDISSAYTVTDLCLTSIVFGK